MPVFLIALTLFLLTRPAATAQQTGDITVCAAGCAYSNLQKAFDEAAPGSRLLLASGETFKGNFRLHYKGPSGDPIIVESTRMDLLPPAGVRIQAEHAIHMPRLMALNRDSAVLRIGSEEEPVEKVDPAADTIQYGGPHGYVNGQPIAFWTDGTAPVGLIPNKIYYVRRISATVIQLAAEKNGPAVDLRTDFRGERLRSGTAETASRYIFRGIEFSVAPGTQHEYGLVELGTTYATSREGIPSQIEMDRVYIHGLPDQNGPRICLMINARQFTIVNSRIEHCNKEGEEGKGIVMVQAPGPGLIANNYVEGGSINLLMGGDYVRVTGLVSGDEGGIEIFNNHFYKPLRLKYTAGAGGAGDPGGRCEGGWYMNTSSGKWFVCDENKWKAGPACSRGEYYRRADVAQNCASGACWECSDDSKFAPSQYYRGSSYYVKNLFEIKSGINVYVHGNVFENNWNNGDQSGVAVWVVSQVQQGNAGGWVRGENILFTNNIIRNSAQGLRLSSDGSIPFGRPNRNVRIVNNLLYDIGTTATPSIASRDGKPVSVAGECIDCQFANNTVVSNSSGGAGVYFDTRPVTGFRFANNVLPNNQYGIYGDGGLPLSFYLKNQPAVNNLVLCVNYDGRFAPGNNRIIFEGRTLVYAAPEAKNYRLDPDSPFSAACQQKCEYAGDNNRDLGANIDLVEMETSGAVAGTANWNDQFGLRFASLEPRKAVLTYYAPDPEVCSLRVSLTPGMRVPVADVNPEAGDNRHLDTRQGNTVENSLHTFVIGGVEPLEPGKQYFFKLSCGARFQAGDFKTAPAEPR